MLTYFAYNLTEKGFEAIFAVYLTCKETVVSGEIVEVESIYLVVIIRRQGSRQQELNLNPRPRRPVYGYWSGFV